MPDAQAVRILVVEDDEDACSNLRDILELDGYCVALAKTGKEALWAPEVAPISVVILDRKLPDKSAEVLLPEFKQRFPELAVIIVTGHGDLDSSVAALRFGAADYILKPINPDELRTTIRRIVDHQQARAALEDRQARIRAILETAPDGILTIDETGCIESANPAAEAMFGYRDGEILGTPVRCLIPSFAEQEPDSFCRRLQDYHGQTLGVEEEILGRRQDGTGFPLELSLSEMTVRGNRRFTGLVRDVTERKQMERALREERDFAESLIETAQAIVLVLDTQGRIVRFNAYMENLCGYRLEAVKGRDWFSTFLLPEETERIEGVFARTLQDIDTSGTVNAILTKDGRRRQIKWANKSLKDDAEQIIGTLSIGQDITELEEAQRRAVQAERLAAIGQAMTGLAHESRNALQRSQSSLEMLSRRVADRPKAVELLTRVQQAQDDLYRLYEEVREYAAPIHVRAQRCHLGEIVAEAWNQLVAGDRRDGPQLREQGREIDLECDVERFAIRQVFRNILENALAACGDGARIEVAYREATLGDQPALEVAIGDNGPGLSPEQRERIFEEFYTTKTHGTGLGMAICRRFVEAHCGEIFVGSGDGPGAEIVIRLPKRQP